jgi:hypothetical protein
VNYSSYLGLGLPSRNNQTDLADVNVLSDNFNLLDMKAKNADNDILANSSEIEKLRIVNTESGSPILLKDSANSTLRNLRLFGKTTESGSVGSNGSFELLMYSKNFLENLAVTTTKNGLSLTVNKDGSMVINGTATATTMFNINTTLNLDGTYILSGCSPEDSQQGLEWLFYDGAWKRDGGSGITFTTSKTKSQKCAINISSGKTITNATIYPMIRLAADTDNTYVPYSKQSLTIPHNLRSKDNARDEIDFLKGIKIQRISGDTILSVPIKTPLTDNEIEAYHQLHTSRGVTRIISEADMEVSYVADPKLYIDNKIAELTALTLEG